MSPITGNTIIIAALCSCLLSQRGVQRRLILGFLLCAMKKHYSSFKFPFVTEKPWNQYGIKRTPVKRGQAELSTSDSTVDTLIPTTIGRETLDAIHPPCHIGHCFGRSCSSDDPQGVEDDSSPVDTGLPFPGVIRKVEELGLNTIA